MNNRLTTQEAKSSWWFDILLISLIALLFYGLFLGSYPLFNPDEGRYSDVVREMLLHNNYVTPLYNGIPFLDKPPLFYWVQTFFVKIFGLNEWGLRLWPVTAATIGCVASYITGRKLFNRRTGVLAAIVLGSSLLYFLMAHVADIDLTVAILITLSLFSFLIALELQNYQRHFYFYAAYLFSALAILAKGLIGILIPVMIVGLWVLLLNRWQQLKRMHIVTGLVLIAIICAPWFYLVQKNNPDFMHYFFYTQQFHRYLTHEFNSRHGLWFYPFLIVAGTLPWTFFVLRALIEKFKLIWKDRQTEKISLFLLIWIVSTTVFFSIPISKTMGYILPVFPPLALMAAAYLDKKMRCHHYHIRLIAPLVICFCLYPIFMFILVSNGEDFGLVTSKHLALQLKSDLKPNDTVVFYDFYYADLALYLNHDVKLAGNFKQEQLKDIWRQDFVEGLKEPKYQNRVMNLKQLNQTWHGSKRIFVFVTKNKMDSFKQTVQSSIYTLGHYRQLWLFSNKCLKNACS